MKLETEAAIDTTKLKLYRPRLLDAKNVKPSSHGRSGIFRAQCLQRLNGMSQTVHVPVRYAAQNSPRDLCMGCTSG